MPHTKKQNTLVLLSNENQKICYRDLTTHLLNKNFEIAVLRWRTNGKWEEARNMFMNNKWIELSGERGETWKKNKEKGEGEEKEDICRMGRAGEGGEGNEREEKIGEEERWGRGGGGGKTERRGRGEVGEEKEDQKLRCAMANWKKIKKKS